MNPQSVRVTAFHRSFVRFRLDLKVTQPKTVSQPPPFTLNNARLSLECLCRITRGEGSAARTSEYVLSASCKAEQVNVSKDIWHDPAADMCLVAGHEEFLVLKSWDRNNRGVMLSPPSLGPQPERQASKIEGTFTELRIDRCETQGVLLNSIDEIVAAVLGNREIVSQSEFTMADGSHVFLEYPVKTINVSERDLFYQTDTGPVLFPDPDAFDGVHEISVLRQAFLAHNSLDCTEFLVNVPTPIGSGLSVNHYSKSVSVSGRHRLIALV